MEDHIPDYAITKDTTAEDYLTGKVDVEGLQALFMQVDETRESIIKKQQSLQKVLKKFPDFRSGLFFLATTWLQLNREGEALEILEESSA